jgi:hypothetical protein
MARKKQPRRARERKDERAKEAASAPERAAVDPAACVGKALADVLPYSDPPPAVPAKVPPEPPGASFPFVGSDVLDVIGSGGAPRREMHDIIHAPDDEIVEHHLGPLEEANVSFRPDPEVGDAGADLAEDFGRSYLQSATADEDMSEVESADDMDPSEVGGPFLEIDDKGNPADESFIEETGGSAGEPTDLPLGEPGGPVPASEPPSGEVPHPLEEAGALACPPDERLEKPRTARAPPREHKKRRPRART